MTKSVDASTRLTGSNKPPVTLRRALALAVLRSILGIGVVAAAALFAQSATPVAQVAPSPQVVQAESPKSVDVERFVAKRCAPLPKGSIPGAAVQVGHDGSVRHVTDDERVSALIGHVTGGKQVGGVRAVEFCA